MEAINLKKELEIYSHVPGDLSEIDGTIARGESVDGRFSGI